MVVQSNVEVLAIIPARGGSKGVPRKNILPIAGKPLIAWTIDAAKKSEHIDRIIVTTDDEEIADVARQHGADVPFLRPAELAQDDSTDIEFIKHALTWLDQNQQYHPDVVLRLAPTFPLRTSEHIDQGICTLLADPILDCVRSISSAPSHPYKAWKKSEKDGRIESLVPPSFTGFEHPYDMPRQVLPKAYVHGAVDVIYTKTIDQFDTVVGKDIGYFEMPSENCIDIDTPIDFDLVELYLTKHKIK